MTWSSLYSVAVVFGTVFLAELGDKTQLATVLFATNRDLSKTMVFFAAGSALLLSTGLAVLVGGWIGQHINEKTLRYAAGAGFVAIGLFTLWRG